MCMKQPSEIGGPANCRGFDLWSGSASSHQGRIAQDMGKKQSSAAGALPLCPFPHIAEPALLPLEEKP